MKTHATNAQEAIRIEAYLLSENAGHPQGMETYFWTQAEALVRSRPGKKSVSQVPARKATPARKPAAKTVTIKAPAAAPKTAKATPAKPKVTASKETAAPKTSGTKKIVLTAAKTKPKGKGTGGQETPAL